MNALKIGLLVIIALLLLAFIVDRAREPSQLERVNESVAALQDVQQKQLQVLQEMQRDLASRPLAAATGPGPGPTAGPAASQSQVPPATSTGAAVTTSAEDPSLYQIPPIPTGDRDGNPKLGVNFLIPYDGSAMHQQWLRGTLHYFQDTGKSLNPVTDNSGTTDDVYDLITDSLCDRPATHPEQWSQSLAESVVISDDYKVFTFSLRKGVMWQRPPLAKQPKYAWLDRDVELTAGDFVFKMQMIMNPAVNCPSLRNYYDGFDHAEAVDPYTFKMVWKAKAYTNLASSLGLAPLPRHIYGCNADGSPIADAQLGVVFNDHWFDQEHGAVGVGAYSLDQFQPDKIMVFKRNPSYWGASFNFDAIEWNLEIKKPDPMLVAFKNGQVNVDSMIPLQYKAEILDHHEPRFAPADPTGATKPNYDGELGWTKANSLGFSYIGWNMRRSPFDDVRVRQAMCYAFPKQRIINEVFYGLGQPVLSDVSPVSQYYDHDLEPYEFDLDKAKALLNAAGWSDADGSGILSKLVNGQKTTLSFTVKYYADSPEWDNTLLIFRNSLKRIGVELKVMPLEWKELMGVYEDKDFEAVVGTWGSTNFDIDFYQLWHSSQADLQGSSNMCGMKNPEIDHLAEQLRQTFETGERIAIAKRIQVLLNQLAPYTYFRSRAGIFAWQNHGPPAEDRYLDGVTFGLDHLNPVKNRSRLWWHFRQN
jgi:ABC-type transport system substrate-binding protein